ncbi:hypothetical protein J4210_03630 [Candidatus Woesearchaeota archaeon]|nr:hypothetical protein [Candidatus Woesearchaeota archaeon]
MNHLALKVHQFLAARTQGRPLELGDYLLEKRDNGAYLHLMGGELAECGATPGETWEAVFVPFSDDLEYLHQFFAQHYDGIRLGVEAQYDHTGHLSLVAGVVYNGITDYYRCLTDAAGISRYYDHQRPTEVVPNQDDCSIQIEFGAVQNGFSVTFLDVEKKELFSKSFPQTYLALEQRLSRLLNDCSRNRPPKTFIQG